MWPSQQRRVCAKYLKVRTTEFVECSKAVVSDTKTLAEAFISKRELLNLSDEIASWAAGKSVWSFFFAGLHSSGCFRVVSLSAGLRSSGCYSMAVCLLPQPLPVGRASSRLASRPHGSRRVVEEVVREKPSRNEDDAPVELAELGTRSRHG